MTELTEQKAQLQAALQKAVSAERLQAHLNHFSTLFRDSGSEDERKAAEYIVETVRGYGVDAEILEFDSLISWPLAGRLALLDANGNETEEIKVRTRSFGTQTPPGGLESDLVFVPFAAPGRGELIFSHRAKAGDYSGLDVTGKIVLTADGGPDGIRRAQEHGAAGHIHIWPSDEPLIHEMIGTSVWGTPTPESAKRLPNLPVLGMTNADGNRLAKQLEGGPIRVRMESNVRTEWMRVPVTTATIPGTDSTGDFLLVGSHLDSWYEGITDNATGNVAMIEMARVLAARKSDLRRGVTFCWWPGHSTGRYSGSTWYADTRFRELRDHAVGYLNIDSPGVRESTLWHCLLNTSEVFGVTEASVQAVTGESANVGYPLRAGDQSFFGVGLASLGAYRWLALDHPDRKAVGGSGGAYWWHTPEDTLDKADANLLAEEVAIFVTMAAKMCVSATIPYDFTLVARDFLENLTPLQEIAGTHLDLTEVIDAANRFMSAAQNLLVNPITDTARLNDRLKRLSRIANSTLYTVEGPYEVDPALSTPILPGLDPMRQLADLDPSTSEFQFLLTKLRRQKNRVLDSLLTAIELAEESTAK